MEPSLQSWSSVRLACSVSVCAFALLLGGLPHLTAQRPALAAAFQQAVDAQRRGHLEEAAAGYEAILRESPRFVGAYMNLGLIREQQNRMQDASRRELALAEQMQHQQEQQNQILYRIMPAPTAAEGKAPAP